MRLRTASSTLSSSSLQATTPVALVVAGFAYVYPFLTGVYLPKDAIHWFFALNQAKNPFAQ